MRGGGLFLFRSMYRFGCACRLVGGIRGRAKAALPCCGGELLSLVTLPVRVLTLLRQGGDWGDVCVCVKDAGALVVLFRSAYTYLRIG